MSAVVAFRHLVSTCAAQAIASDRSTSIRISAHLRTFPHTCAQCERIKAANTLIKTRPRNPQGRNGRRHIRPHGLFGSCDLSQSKRARLQTCLSTGRSRWGESLTAEKMMQCVWIKPELSARIEFLEGTEAGRLRHSRFVRLDD